MGRRARAAVAAAAALAWALAGPGDALAARRVGLVIDHGGRSDRGFNAAAVEGLKSAAKSFKPLGLATEVLEAKDDAGHEPLLRQLASKGFDLVIALGEARAGALGKVAGEFPKTHFAIVDTEVPGPNIRSILFRENEGSYLVGALAAWVAKAPKLGFVGGMDVPVIRKYEAGFAAGAKKARAGATVLVDYIGDTSAAWSDQARARELALGQYEQGAEVIFAASGSANLGVFAAADERKRLAIGVSNQNWVKPGRVLTSMRKRVDVAVLITCQDEVMGSFSADTKRYGLVDQGVDFVMDQHNSSLVPKEVLERVQKLKEDLIAGRVSAPEARVGAAP